MYIIQELLVEPMDNKWEVLRGIHSLGQSLMLITQVRSQAQPMPVVLSA